MPPKCGSDLTMATVISTTSSKVLRLNLRPGRSPINLLSRRKFITLSMSEIRSGLVPSFSWVAGLVKSQTDFVNPDKPNPATHKEFGISIYGLSRYRTQKLPPSNESGVILSSERLPSKQEQRTTTRDSDLQSSKSSQRRYVCKEASKLTQRWGRAAFIACSMRAARFSATYPFMALVFTRPRANAGDMGGLSL